MWWVTGKLSSYLSSSHKQASTKWNLILSKDLGYSGFADKSGRGIIHASEPMQAVFLRKNAFELLYRERNEPKKNEFNLNTEEGQIEFILAFPDKIQSIENPSEKVQLAIVKNYPSEIEEFKNPSEKVQLQAVRSGNVYGRTIISYIKNPTEKVQIESLKIEDYPKALQFIDNPSEKVQLEVLKKELTAIKHLKNPSEKVQLQAIQEYPNNIKYIKNPTEKAQIEAIKKLGIEAITYIKKPTKKAIDLMHKMSIKKESQKRVSQKI
jgi:hypothetical protein